MRAVEWTTRLTQSIFPKLHEVLFRGVRLVRPLRQVTASQDPLVSVLVVTDRPAQLDHVVASYDAQTTNKELVLVTNSDHFSISQLERITSRPDVIHIATAPEVSLGAALNLAVTASSGEVLAKFDDDDHYSDTYLAAAVAVIQRTHAGVVGKKTYFVYLEERDETLLVYPGNEGRRVGRVAGGTIVAHRDVFKRVSFPECNLGEDVLFVRRAERAGFAVLSAAPTGSCNVAVERATPGSSVMSSLLRWEPASAEVAMRSCGPGNDLWVDDVCG